MVTKGRIIVIVAGASGVGKSTVIRHLTELEPMLRRVPVYTLRESRDSNEDKKHVSMEQLEELERTGSVIIFRHYNSIYGEPLAEVINMQNNGHVPIMDISIDYVKEWLSYVGGKSFVVYLLPESLTKLEERLHKEGRDPKGERLAATRSEIAAVEAGKYDDVIDVSKINQNSKRTAHSLISVLKGKIDEITVKDR